MVQVVDIRDLWVANAEIRQERKLIFKGPTCVPGTVLSTLQTFHLVLTINTVVLTTDDKVLSSFIDVGAQRMMVFSKVPKSWHILCPIIVIEKILGRRTCLISK